MNRSWLTGVLAGVCVIVAIFAVTGGLQAQGTPKCCVASVNVGLVFSEYEKKKATDAELDQLQARLESENTERLEKGNALEATINAMDRNDPTYLEKLNEVLEVRASHKTWFELKQAHIARELGLVTDGIYRDILQAIGEVAQDAGYDLVLYKDEYQPASIAIEEIQATMRARHLLYSSQEVDITQFVLSKLNADYRSRPPTPQLRVP